MSACSTRQRSTLPMRIAFWLALAIPGGLMLRDWQSGTALAMELTEPSGLMAIRLLVLALLPGPLSSAFGVNRLLRGWLSVRRNLGVAVLAYAILHLWFYAADLGGWRPMLGEIGLPGIWTGWFALLLLLPPALASSDRAMAVLRRRWKPLQRLVYGAIALGFIHWLLLEWNPGTAAVHIAPLILAWTLRLWRRLRFNARRTA